VEIKKKHKGDFFRKSCVSFVLIDIYEYILRKVIIAPEKKSANTEQKKRSHSSLYIPFDNLSVPGFKLKL